MMKNFKFIGNCKTVDKYCIYPSELFEYPYVLKEDKRYHISGELYEISYENLISFDKFENSPFVYLREVIEVNCEDKIYEAHIYFKSILGKDTYQNIPLDNWLIEFEEIYKKLYEAIDLSKKD